MTPAFAASFHPGWFFASDTHRNALAGLVYSASHRLPVTLLSGPAGAGKSALLAELVWRIERCRAPLMPVLLEQTPESGEHLCETLARRLNCGTTLEALRSALGRKAAQDVTPLLLLDDADRLPAGVWDRILTFSRWHRDALALLPTVLSGSSAMNDLLPLPLSQALDASLDLVPLRGEEIVRYIEHLWHCAGPEPLPFGSETLRSIAGASQGLPRVINRLCRQALRLPPPAVRTRKSRKIMAMAQAPGARFVPEELTQ